MRIPTRPVARLAALASMAIATAVTAEPSAAAFAPDAVGNPEVVAPGDESFLYSSTALDGDTMAVAGCDLAGGECVNAVYIYVRSDSDWVLQASLTPSVEVWDFGQAVAVSGDTVVVGAGREPDGLNHGSAFVFARSGSTWVEQAKLTPPIRQAGDHFGTAVAVDGDTVVVGAWNRKIGGQHVGTAYAYVRAAGAWSLQSELTAPPRGEFNDLGAAVAIDGDTVLVGAPSGDYPKPDAGKVEVFTRSGTVWSRRATLVAPDATREDAFGAALALDGDTAAIGTSRFWAGRRERAYVFVGSGSTWNAQARFRCDCDDDLFGETIDVSGDTVVVGAMSDTIEEEQNGSAYVYRRSGDTWSRFAHLTAPDPVYHGRFGRGVAVDGTTLLVGSEAGRGQVFVYER